MAIFFNEIGVPVLFGVNTFNMTNIAGIQGGDMLLALVGGKPHNSTVSMSDNTGGVWNALGPFTDGTVAAGNDTGSMFVRGWWKTANGSESTFTLTEGATTWNVVGGFMVRYSKDGTDTWDTPVMVGGGDATSGTAFSVTAGSNPGITTGDHCVTFGAFPSDGMTPLTGSGLLPTATGVTFTNTRDPATDPETTTGGDMGMSVTRSTVSGTASAAPVLAGTLAAAGTGSAALVRLRVTAAPPSFQPRHSAIDFGDPAIL